MGICVLSFFDNEYQYKLKKQCFSNQAFEVTLEKYRDIFLEKLHQISHVSVNKECNMCSECLMRVKLSNEFQDYLNDFLDDILDKEDIITKLFNEVIDIYLTAISENRAKATNMMKDYIDRNQASFSVSGSLFFSKPMFRVRSVGAYNANDIHELFHVPFDKRYKIENQRFSITGIPLLYLAESLPLALRETECEINNANVAVFLPNYSRNYNNSVYSIKP